jgi:hypothetical protein
MRLGPTVNKLYKEFEPQEIRYLSAIKIKRSIPFKEVVPF